MTTRHFVVAYIILVLLGLRTVQLRAQAAHEGVPSAIMSAVDTVFTSLSMSVDSGEIFHIDLSALPASVDKESVAERLAMGQARRTEVFRCPPFEGRRPEKNCFIEGADYLVTIHDFSISDRTASVEVELQGEHEGEDFRSVWSGGWLVLLNSAEGGWSVTEVKPLWER